MVNLLAQLEQQIRVNEQIAQNMRDRADNAFEKVLMEPEDAYVIASSTVDTIDDTEDSIITFDNSIDIGSPVAIELSRSFLTSCGIETSPVTANPWSMTSLPPVYLGVLDDVEVGSYPNADERSVLENTLYNIVLDAQTTGEKVGVKVSYEEFAYKSKKNIEIGMRCIAPLYDLKQTSYHLYTGFVIETPKQKSAKHGNDMRVLVFFDCGIWRYVDPEEVLVFQPSLDKKENQLEYFINLFKKAEPFPYDQFQAKASGSYFYVLQSSNFVQDARLAGLLDFIEYFSTMKTIFSSG